ncbi:unnamed protein product, partial [Brassica rapa subsp. narinosa]
MLPWNWNVSRVGESKDWRKGGVVTPVKKQGGCGKLARITYYNKSLRIGKNYIHSIRNLVSLSKQQLIDCDRARNHGCKGRSMSHMLSSTVHCIKPRHCFRSSISLP